MVIPKVQLQKLTANVQIAGGVTKLKCVMKFTGSLNDEVVEQLKIHPDNLSEFKVPREEKPVSLTFSIAKLEMGDHEEGAPANFRAPGEKKLCISKASLHRYEGIRDKNGAFKVKMTASFDQAYHLAVAQFFNDDSATLFDVTIEPDQKEMFDEQGQAAEPASSKKRGRKKAAKKKAAKKPKPESVGPQVVH